MSTSAKKKTATGVRYTDAQKKEAIDFANNYNATNGRGGQTQAAIKFGISPLTVAAWLSASGAPKAAKPSKDKSQSKNEKPSKAANAKTTATVGTRYTPEQKQEVLDFVTSYNASNGRGGQSTAAAKFGISPLTVMAWLKASGAPKPGKKIKTKKNSTATKTPKATKAAEPAKAPKAAANSGFSAKLDALVKLNKQIEQAETTLAALQSQFATLKASL